MAAPPALQQWVLDLEAAILAKVEADPEEYVKGATPEHIKTLWRSAIKLTQQMGPVLRCKINMGGTHPVRCWGSDRQPQPLPEDLGGARIVPLVCARCVWVANGTMGVSFEITDMHVVSARTPEECPWDF